MAWGSWENTLDAQFSLVASFSSLCRRYFLRLPKPQVHHRINRISHVRSRIFAEQRARHVLDHDVWSCQLPTVLFFARLGAEADTGDDRAISVLIDMLADKDPDWSAPGVDG